MASSFTLDIGSVLKRLNLADEKTRAGVEMGLGRAMLQLKNDMVMQRPTAPIDEGFLRGSTSIFVQNKHVDVPMAAGEKPDKQLLNYEIPIKKSEFVGIIGVNVPYAARWHEVPAHFQEPSAGNKYLESKMANNKMIYTKIIVNTIKAALQ